jgi:hypothetical protein
VRERGGWVKHNTNFVSRLCRDFNVMVFSVLCARPLKIQEMLNPPAHSSPDPSCGRKKSKIPAEKISSSSCENPYSPENSFRKTESIFAFLHTASIPQISRGGVQSVLPHFCFSRSIHASRGGASARGERYDYDFENRFGLGTIETPE